jgi:fibronectin type 3 domain-containing protein
LKVARIAGFGLLGLILIAGVGVLGGSSGSVWRDKASPSILRWVDSSGLEERVVLVTLKAGAVPEPAGVAYMEAAHIAWLSDAMRSIADAVAAIAPLERSPELLRAGSAVWELGLPYIHELRSISARCSADDVARLAQLSFVEAIADASDLVLTLPVAASGASSGTPEGTSSPNALFGRGRLTASELEQGAEAYSWSILHLSDVVRQTEEAKFILSPSPVAEWEGDGYQVVGLGVDEMARATAGSVGVSVSVLLQGEWGVGGVASLSTAELAWLVDALRQTGADTAVLSSVNAGDRRFPVYALLRSETTLGLASLSGVENASQVGGLALPRAAAPAGVSATRGTHEGRVFLYWEAAGGAGQYEVLRSEAAAGAFEPIGISGAAGFDDVDVEACTVYWYRVRAFGGGSAGLESSASSGYVGLVPRAPERVWTSDETPGEIRVEWTPADGATGYRLMRTQPMSDKPKVAAQQYVVYEGENPWFSDKDVVVGQKYLYRVFALNGCGESELSPQAEGMSMVQLPPDRGHLNPPTWVEATRGRPYERVLVSWRAVPGAEAYRILRALEYGGPYETMAETDSTTWDDLGVVLCGDYWYRVQSLSGADQSAPSATAYGSYGYRPVAPGGVRASAGTYANSIEITWRAVADAVYYIVSRAPSREGPFAILAEGLTTMNLIDEGLVPGQEFWYKVKAANPCGCSGDEGPAYGATAAK